MSQIINTIKKSFIYIVGILFFIVALYVLLLPPNCSIMTNNKSVYEAFVGDITSKNVNNIPQTTLLDSITTYKDMIGEKLNAVVNYDLYLQTNIDIIPDRTSKKALIFSRCYQMKLDSPLLKSLKNNFTPNIFNSYTEAYTFNSVSDFGSDILNDCIINSVNTFYKLVNMDIDAKSFKKILGTVYVLIIQNPYYYDTKTKSTLHINSSILSQTNGQNKSIYYSPSYSAPISNKVSDTAPTTTTPISYQVYIIYDKYSNGPNTTTNNTLTTLDDGNTFSTLQKQNTTSRVFTKSYLDSVSLSSATQCYISAMGAGGMQYIGGCASYNGVGPNKTFCSSQTQGDQSPWAYITLYTVNSTLIEKAI